MKAEHTQTLEEFVTAYNAKINEFTQQKGEALNQFNQDKAQAFAAADSQLQQRRAAVDAVLADVTKSTDFFVHHFDKAIHTQTSLGAAIDLNDESKTKWVKVPTNSLGRHGSAVAGTKAEIVLPKAYARPGGYPDYAEDKSYTFPQFILASYIATSEQINAAIEEQQTPLFRAGTWGDGGQVSQVPVIDISGLHPYKALFVRFINIPYGGGTVAQNVIDFGGNPSFSVDRIINFFRTPV